MTIVAAAVLGLGCAATDTGNGAPTSPAPEDKSGTPAETDPAAEAPADPAAGAPADPGAPAGGDCAALDAQACKTTEGCQTVRGSRVIAVEGAADAAHCVQARADVGCIEAQMCAEAITYFCNDKGEVLEVTNACGPAGWTQCDAPAKIQGACAP